MKRDLYQKDTYEMYRAQTCKMLEILTEQDSSFPDFNRKCVNYVNSKIAKKTQPNLSANAIITTFTSLHNVY